MREARYWEAPEKMAGVKTEQAFSLILAVKKKKKKTGITLCDKANIIEWFNRPEHLVVTCRHVKMKFCCNYEYTNAQ